MDETKDRFNAGRTQMITAFTKALGHVDRATAEELQGEFFDGHTDIKRAFGVMCLMAHVSLPEGWDRWWVTSDERQESGRSAAPGVPESPTVTRLPRSEEG